MTPDPTTANPITPYLLIDFGTTSTKSALVDLENGVFSQVRRHDALPRLDKRPGRYEVDPAAIWQRFSTICATYDALVPLAGIVVCAEMHGFVLLDDDDVPISPYIGWLDGRSLEEIDGESTFSLLERQLGPDFKHLTGMRPRPGFPLFNLLHLARDGGLPSRVRPATLPDWLALCTGTETKKAHPTMLAATAFFDVERQRPADQLLDAVTALGGPRCRFNQSTDAIEAAAYWQGSGRQVPLYVGVGDHQCSVLGAGNGADDSLSLNLGTGSQVSLIDHRVEHGEVETRPFFGYSFLQTVSHIPAGRVLNEFIGFLSQVNPQRDFWSLLAQLDEDTILKAPLAFDLSLFEGARRYSGGGSIAAINEGQWTLDHYLAGLLKAFSAQYLEVLDIFDQQRRLPRCILSGGIARQLPVLHRILQHQSGYEVLPATDLDESLLGLRALALLADGRCADYSQAQAQFGRQCLTD
jgi:sugar (pentulose or hexulose) kinase